MLTLDPLHVFLTNDVFLRVHITLVGTPAVCVVPGDIKRLQQSLKAKRDLVLPPSEHISQDLSGVMINDVPQLMRMRFLAHVTPRFIKHGEAEGLSGLEMDDQLPDDRAFCRPQSTAPRMLVHPSQRLRAHHQPALTPRLEHPEAIPMEGRPARHEQRHGAADLDLRGAHRHQCDMLHIVAPYTGEDWLDGWTIFVLIEDPW